MTDKLRKYVLPNIPYVFIGWVFLKLGTAYRLAAGSDFAHKFIGLGQTVGAAFADFAPGLAPFDWLVGIVGAVVCPLSGLLIVWPLLMWLPLTPQMQGVLVLYAALPPAVMNYIFAEQYRQEPAQVSAIVVIGSIASIFFIPLALSFVL